jgi:hypothetical protein
VAVNATKSHESRNASLQQGAKMVSRSVVFRACALIALAAVAPSTTHAYGEEEPGEYCLGTYIGMDEESTYHCCFQEPCFITAGRRTNPQRMEYYTGPTCQLWVHWGPVGDCCSN